MGAMLCSCYRQQATRYPDAKTLGYDKEHMDIPSMLRPSAPPSPHQNSADRPLPNIVHAWYVIARSRDFRRGKTMRFRLADTELVIYHGRSGRAYVLSAHCSHIGRVIGDRLQCPLHHWEYDGGERCVNAGSNGRCPTNYLQRAFPDEEQHVHTGVATTGEDGV